MLSLKKGKWILIILIANILVSGLWLFVANWVLSFSQSHNWLSSFVEIAFSLNAIVSIPRVVEEYVKPSKETLHRKINKCVYEEKKRVTKQYFQKFKELGDRAISRFEDEALPKLTLNVRLAQIMSVISLLVLLGYDENIEWVSWVPTLILPPIWFSVTFCIMAIMAWLDFVEEFKILVQQLYDRK